MYNDQDMDNKDEPKKALVRQVLGSLWLLAFMTTVALMVLKHYSGEASPGSKVDPFSGPLVIDAPGCEITGPDGKSIKEAIREQALIPKGAMLNDHCFPAAKAARKAESSSQNCSTTGPDSPIITGANSVVVVNSKAYAPGQNADCVPGAAKISTHGAGSPIVTGAGARVTSTVER